MQFKTIFWGNSDFVLPALEFLYEYNHIAAIFTGPDQPYGRNKKQTKVPEPKIFGHKHNIPVFQDTDLKNPEIEKRIRALKPDLMVVISYGKIIPKNLFDIPQFGTVNIHASLLPNYRGASPIQQTLFHGDKETGITIQKINEKLDEGDVFAILPIPVEENDTAISLRRKLADLSVKGLAELIGKLKNKETVEFIPQNGTPSYCRKIHKEDGKIDWQNETAHDIFNKWRAFIQWPEIFTSYKETALKIKKIELIDWDLNEPGEIVQADKKGLIVKAKENAIEILSLQPANGKEISYLDFLNGYKLKVGEKLG
ncbi:MAG TPA: methionyl-tRNA formyltransferase [Spirochaetia bacterium]|nr:MAG: methionyl-tRNA formyltransferase [Spirochaetes bacterium GWB1_36_13]HCL56192.1 methionyl-tRNA formyltransferase [Spirochaetia bacterium]